MNRPPVVAPPDERVARRLAASAFLVIVDPMIRLDSIHKAFGETVAVDGVTLEAEAGATTVLIGPSGCGKSTILRLIVGLEPADAGRIEVGGTPVGPDTVDRIRRRIGYVIQSGGLFPHMTARENVTLMAEHLDWAAGRIDERVEALTRLTHLNGPLLQKYPAQLSGGQKQRIALMRALMLDPEVLLLDEPLGALDPMIRADLQRELREIFARLDKTVLLVTHDMDEAAFFADTVVLMRGGELVQVGGARQLVESPAEPFVREFVRAQAGARDLWLADAAADAGGGTESNGGN